MAAFTAASQEMAKPVRVTAKTDTGDHAGALLVYALREELRRSSGAILVDEPEAWRISLICSDPDEGDQLSGRRTVCSIAITFEGNGAMRGLLEDHFLTTCGNKAVESCAKRIAASLDALNGKFGMRRKPQ